MLGYIGSSLRDVDAPETSYSRRSWQAFPSRKCATDHHPGSGTGCFRAGRSSDLDSRALCGAGTEFTSRQRTCNCTSSGR